MTHEEVRELLPAYALGALDADERDAVADHLRDCRLHDEELVELRATVLALGTLVEEREPSSALTHEIARLSGAGDASPEAARLPRRLLARERWWWRTVAAAAVVVVVFAAGWLLGGRLGAEERYSYLVQSDGVVLQFSGVAGDAAVTVWMAGLERLPPDQRYQLWAIRDDRWLSIGVCNTNAEGRWLGDFAFTLATDEEIALTIEPTPGSDRPTGDPVLRTRF